MAARFTPRPRLATGMLMCGVGGGEIARESHSTLFAAYILCFIILFLFFGGVLFNKP